MLYSVCIRPLRVVSGLLVKCFGRLFDKRPFSYTENKPGRGGGLAVLAVQVGVVGLEALAVEPAAVHVLRWPAIRLRSRFPAPARPLQL